MQSEFKILACILITGLCNSLCAEPDAVEVMVVAPKVVYPGMPASVSLTTTAGGEPASAAFVIQLLSEPAPQVLASGATPAGGHVSVQFTMPPVPAGSHTLRIEVEGAAEPLSASVQLKELPFLLVETDKPIYKPGQTLHGRVLVLDGQLRPESKAVTVEISDGKGVKIFRESLPSNPFGVAAFELPLATELNYGTWKISARCGSGSAVADVRVEEYVLPRFQVDVQTARDYFLVDEPITGTITTKYFFGQPVEGTVTVRASKWIGEWDEYATFEAPLAEGEAEFTLPAAGYVAGTQGAEGAGTVQLDVVAMDTAGHEEKTTTVLKIVASEIRHQIIARSRVMVPDAPLPITLIAENQAGYPVSVSGEVACTYYDSQQVPISTEKVETGTFKGSLPRVLHVPKEAARAEIVSTVHGEEAAAEARLWMYASWSPTDSFLYLSRDSQDAVSPGEMITIDVLRTHPVTVYYDVVARGRTVWSGYSTEERIAFQATPEMFPSGRVVAYIVNPNNEISADTLSFDVALEDLAPLSVSFDQEQVLPGEAVELSVQADREAMVGLTLVDESVYALNEGRLNMQEVFKELERLFMEPQVEEHPDMWNTGAAGAFEEANLQVITSAGLTAPEGKDVWRGDWWWLEAVTDAGNGGAMPLAEVTRVRQFFPETWVWEPELMTDGQGAASLSLTAPDSITTWRLRAVSTSEAGLGMAESSLLVFQEFFGEPDLPYAVTRGEEFPVRVQIYNYVDEPQTVQVELAKDDWFDLLDETAVQYVEVAANAVSMASFRIRPTEVGDHPLEVTLRSPRRADAVRKSLKVEPEGTQREIVANDLIEAGETVPLDTSIPEFRVADSEKVILALTPSLAVQGLNGLEDLLGMPYGCGEQNMIFMAPDVEVLRYFEATGQGNPEVRAKAEHFITVGYQRELTYRRQDGSFSAFGDSDDSGSLWLTAFVLGVFSGAREFHAIDETVLAQAADWIVNHQAADGSWTPVGFIHHKEMIGGMSSDFALTGFVTIALLDYGQTAAASVDDAVSWLTANTTGVWDDAYALAIAACALQKAQSPAAAGVLDRLIELAIRDEDGMHWEPHGVETTAYAALALMAAERPQANEAIQWLSLQQNANGGFGQTQDTVMGLKALMTAARNQTRDIDLTIEARRVTEEGPGEVLAHFQVNQTNFDVLQSALLPADTPVELAASGSGKVRFQLTRRFHVRLGDDTVNHDMRLDVQYHTDHVAVDDIVDVTVTVRYLGAGDESGMMIVDVGVPTGFAVVQESLDALVAAGKVSRVETAGRKVIFYLDGLAGGAEAVLDFQVKARWPVRAVIPDSKAYLYYEPQVRAEAAGASMTVVDPADALEEEFMERLRAMAADWLQNVTPPAPDYNSDGVIDLRDFAILSQRWLGEIE